MSSVCQNILWRNLSLQAGPNCSSRLAIWCLLNPNLEMYAFLKMTNPFSLFPFLPLSVWAETADCAPPLQSHTLLQTFPRSPRASSSARRWKSQTSVETPSPGQPNGSAHLVWVSCNGGWTVPCWVAGSCRRLQQSRFGWNAVCNY